MATAAGPSCGPSAPGVKPPSVLRPGCCCYMQEIARVDYWHQAHSSSLGGPRHFGTGPGLTWDPVSSDWNVCSLKLWIWHCWLLYHSFISWKKIVLKVITFPTVENLRLNPTYSTVVFRASRVRISAFPIPVLPLSPPLRFNVTIREPWTSKSVFKLFKMH